MDNEEHVFPEEIRWPASACVAWGLGFGLLAISVQWFFYPAGQDPTTPMMDFQGLPQMLLWAAMPAPVVGTLLFVGYYIRLWRGQSTL